MNTKEIGEKLLQAFLEGADWDTHGEWLPEIEIDGEWHEGYIERGFSKTGVIIAGVAGKQFRITLGIESIEEEA